MPNQPDQDWKAKYAGFFETLDLEGFPDFQESETDKLPLLYAWRRARGFISNDDNQFFKDTGYDVEIRDVLGSNDKVDTFHFQAEILKNIILSDHLTARQRGVTNLDIFALLPYHQFRSLGGLETFNHAFLFGIQTQSPEAVYRQRLANYIQTANIILDQRGHTQLPPYPFS